MAVIKTQQRQISATVLPGTGLASAVSARGGAASGGFGPALLKAALLSAILGLILMLVALRPVMAQTLPEDFFGHWVGSGIAEDADTLFLGLSQRDLDVVIEPRDDGVGFIVDWTTVIRSADDGGDEVRRRQTRLAMVPGYRDGLFVSPESGDPLTGGVASWATVDPDGTRFVVYQVLLNGAGAPETVRYERVLGEEGMELFFIRVRDGAIVREVHGRLSRAE